MPQHIPQHHTDSEIHTLIWLELAKCQVIGQAENDGRWLLHIDDEMARY